MNDSLRWFLSVAGPIVLILAGVALMAWAAAACIRGVDVIVRGRDPIDPAADAAFRRRQRPRDQPKP